MKVTIDNYQEVIGNIGLSKLTDAQKEAHSLIVDGSDNFGNISQLKDLMDDPDIGSMVALYFEQLEKFKPEPEKASSREPKKRSAQSAKREAKPRTRTVNIPSAELAILRRVKNMDGKSKTRPQVKAILTSISKVTPIRHKETIADIRSKFEKAVAAMEKDDTLDVSLSDTLKSTIEKALTEPRKAVIVDKLVEAENNVKVDVKVNYLDGPEKLEAIIAKKELALAKMKKGTRRFLEAEEDIYRLKKELRRESAFAGVPSTGATRNAKGQFVSKSSIQNRKPKASSVQRPASSEKKLSGPEEDQEPTPTTTDPKFKELGIQTSKDILNTAFDTLPFDGAWGEFMQTPGANLKAVVYGKPKNGKTSFSFQWADYLTAFGPVLYVLADQGIGEATKQLIRNMKVGGNEELMFKAFRDMKTLDQMAASGLFKFIFIDLINNFRISAQEMETFFHKYPDIGIILVMESTKGGDFRGEQKWTHIVDAIIHVENWVATNTGRYGSGTYAWPKP